MRKHSVCIGLALILSACNDYTAPTTTVDPSVPAAIALAPSATGNMTAAGDTRSIVAVVKNSKGAAITPAAVDWKSSVPAVATVVNDGNGAATITAVGDGTTTISARSGSIENTATIVVRRALASVTVTLPNRLLEYGLASPIFATAFDARHNAIPNVTGFTYTTDNPSAAFVEQSGIVTALFAFPIRPDAVITATVTRDGVTRSGTVNMMAVEPPVFNTGALLLSENVFPQPLPSHGSGLAIMNRNPTSISSRVLWADLTGPATSVQIRGPGALTDSADVLVQLGPLPEAGMPPVINSLISNASIRSQHGRPPISLDSLKRLICSSLTHVEVRTARFPDGEIRGGLNCID
ncbi:MAG: CHRD domain-containing protein [Gemmatimonadaceae bacterium]